MKNPASVDGISKGGHAEGRPQQASRCRKALGVTTRGLALLEFGEMWVAGDEEMRSGGACAQGNEVTIAGVRWLEGSFELTTPTAASCTRGSSRRRGPPRPSRLWSRWCATTAGSARLYTDRGSHFCHSEWPGAVADEQPRPGQPGLARAWHPPDPGPVAAGPRPQRARLRHHLGALPQEQRHNGITDYAAANRYLEQVLHRGLQSPLHRQAGAQGKRFHQAGRDRTGAVAVEPT